MYGADQTGGTAEGDDSDEDAGDIEAEIQKEVNNIRTPGADPLFTSVKLDTQCCKLNSPCVSAPVTDPSVQ
jgi:tRNA acetyltransferase TAN1